MDLWYHGYYVAQGVSISELRYITVELPPAFRGTDDVHSAYHMKIMAHMSENCVALGNKLYTK